MKNASLPLNKVFILDNQITSPKSTSNNRCHEKYQNKYDLVLHRLLEIYKKYLEDGFLLPDKIREALIVFAGLDEDFFTSLKTARSSKFGIIMDEETELDNLFVPVPNPRNLCHQAESKMNEEINYVLGVLENL